MKNVYREAVIILAVMLVILVWIAVYRFLPKNSVHTDDHSLPSPTASRNPSPSGVSWSTPSPTPTTMETVTPVPTQMPRATGTPTPLLPPESVTTVGPIS